jgi:hypothetical protein
MRKPRSLFLTSLISCLRYDPDILVSLAPKLHIEHKIDNILPGIIVAAFDKDDGIILRLLPEIFRRKLSFPRHSGYKWYDITTFIVGKRLYQYFPMVKRVAEEEDEIRNSLGEAHTNQSIPSDLYVNFLTEILNVPKILKHVLDNDILPAEDLLESATYALNDIESLQYILGARVYSDKQYNDFLITSSECLPETGNPSIPLEIVLALTLDKMIENKIQIYEKTIKDYAHWEWFGFEMRCVLTSRGVSFQPLSEEKRGLRPDNVYSIVQAELLARGGKIVEGFYYLKKKIISPHNYMSEIEKIIVTYKREYGPVSEQIGNKLFKSLLTINEYGSRLYPSPLFISCFLRNGVPLTIKMIKRLYRDEYYRYSDCLAFKEQFFMSGIDYSEDKILIQLLKNVV